MDKSRLKFSLLESLLVVALFSILLAFVIQIHWQEIHFP
jgi:Tfp pilus assembly protein FimT